MSVMNLGLEALGIQNENTEVLSYEYLDAVIEYSDACDEMNIVFDQFDTVLRAAQNLEAVKDVIAAQGVTPALEALVGGNFKNGLSLEAIEASMEAADGAIVGFIKKIWSAIKQFLLKFFSSTKGMRERLQNFRKELRDNPSYTVSGTEFKGLKLEVVTTLKTKLSVIKELGRNAKGQFETKKSLKRDTTVTSAKAADVENKLSDLGIAKYGEPVAEQTISTVEDAMKYAEALYDLLTEYDKFKDTMIKECDLNISKAESTAGGDVAAAKAAKELVEKAFKQVFSSAAAFLSHTKIVKESAEDGKQK